MRFNCDIKISAEYDISKVAHQIYQPLTLFFFSTSCLCSFEMPSNFRLLVFGVVFGVTLVFTDETEVFFLPRFEVFKSFFLSLFDSFFRTGLEASSSSSEAY